MDRRNGSSQTFPSAFYTKEDSELNILGILVGSNDLILSRIFSFMGLEDLKSCRLVNTKWLDISQSYFNEKSVIRIEYENTEKTDSAGKFLSSFKDSPLSVVFTGVLIQFQGFLTFQWKNDPILDFLQQYGSQIKYFKMEVLNGIIGKDLSFFGFKKILSSFTPELKHLCIDIHFCDGELTTIDYALLEAAVKFKLPKLTKLEWSTVTDDWWDYPTQRLFQKTFTPPLVDLLKSAPNLNSILTEGSSFNSEAFDSLREENISQIKEISVYPRTSLHQLHTFLNKLTDLSQKNLKLSVFNVVACDVDESWPLWKQAFFLSLLKFLNTQKNCLRKLNFQVPMCDSPFKYNSLPPFPKMTKLTDLNIHCSRSFLKMLLGESHGTWNDLFPNLERLHFSFDNPFSCDVALKVIFGDTVNKTVKHVRLHPKCGETNAKGDDDIEAYIADIANIVHQNYDFVKNIFRDMLTLELVDENMGIMYLFHGSKDNYRYIKY